MSFFSNSTSRLILPRHRQQNPSPVIVAHPSGVVASSSTQHFASRSLAESGKRFASTEGRFTIIDERNKGPDSDEASSDESDDEPIMMGESCYPLIKRDS
uniref:Ovule protein n=1 Tax=Steinernema glaseri TaxID=37863 RepID=A0A1I8AUZ3_9BILA